MRELAGQVIISVEMILIAFDNAPLKTANYTD